MAAQIAADAVVLVAQTAADAVVLVAQTAADAVVLVAQTAADADVFVAQTAADDDVMVAETAANDDVLVAQTGRLGGGRCCLVLVLLGTVRMPRLSRNEARSWLRCVSMIEIDSCHWYPHRSTSSDSSSASSSAVEIFCSTATTNSWTVRPE